MLMSTTTVATPALAPTASLRPVGASSRVGLAMLVPYLLVFAIFVVYPVLFGLYLGRHVESYRQLFEDPAFLVALRNTIIFLVVAVNVKFLLALGLSGFFVSSRAWVKIVLVIFILPWAIPSIPTILSFRIMLNPENGIVNQQLFRLFGIVEGPNWLNEPWLAFTMAIVVHIWKSLPFWTLILITGRLAIPHELYEAAAVDGASSWNQFRHVTWPSLATLYVTSTMLSTIWTLGDFNSVYLLTGGGPGDSTQVLATLGIRYLRIDKLDLGISAIIVAMPLVLPLVYVMVRRLSRGAVR